MNSISDIVIISTTIGLGTAATTFMGNMIYPNLQDWRDYAGISILGCLISSHYALYNLRTLKY
tara:strand:+ start:4325 stop:4513 length:189 start_codon:yes stop_codon:yes gene_type:complete